MKSPRDIRNEKSGKRIAPPMGGKARARQQQFEQERTGGATHATAVESCDDPPKAKKK
jgi:hypothetical protein